MDFGLKPATGTESAAWIKRSLDDHLGTVGGLVPNWYEALLRVHAPAESEDWWSTYCELFATIAAIGQRHTATPDQAWFAIWEGHGFDDVGQKRVPRFELPYRCYYLVEGSLIDVAELRYPGWTGWRNPDLFWPDDRRWFVATDVDFWSLYIGGDHDFIIDIVAGMPTSAERVTSDYPLEIEA